MGRYGKMATNNNAITQAGISTVPTKVLNLGVDLSRLGVDVFADDSKLRIKVPGLYFVFMQLSFQKDVTDVQDNYHVFLYKNGVNTGDGFSRNLKAGYADLGPGTIFSVLDLDVGDVLELFIHTDTDNAATITVVDCQFGVGGF